MSEFKVGEIVYIKGFDEYAIIMGSYGSREEVQYSIKTKNNIEHKVLATMLEHIGNNPQKSKELEQRIEKLEKCVMGEQNSLEKRENVSFMSKLTKGNIEDLKYWREIGYKWTCKDEKGSIHIFKIKPTIYNIEELLKGECGNE